MNIALILAGGKGTRTEQNVPKQFISVDEKPIIIHTLEVFEQHTEIDNIVVVCLEGWHDVLAGYAREYHITKLGRIVSGGENSQESIRNGIMELKDTCREDDVLIIHDAIRPMVTAEIISDCIDKCRQFGSGLSAIQCQETIVRTEDRISGDRGIERSEIMRVQTPQAYPYGKLVWAQEQAKQRGIQDTVYINTLLLELGEKLYFSKGSSKNIKITTLDDLDIFNALYKNKRQIWFK